MGRLLLVTIRFQSGRLCFLSGRFNAIHEGNNSLESIVIVLFQYKGDLWGEVQKPSDGKKFKTRSGREIIQMRSCSSTAASFAWFWKTMMTKPSEEYLNAIHGDNYEFLQGGMSFKFSSSIQKQILNKRRSEMTILK